MTKESKARKLLESYAVVVEQDDGVDIFVSNKRDALLIFAALSGEGFQPNSAPSEGRFDRRLGIVHFNMGARKSPDEVDVAYMSVETDVNAFQERTGLAAVVPKSEMAAALTRRFANSQSPS